MNRVERLQIAGLVAPALRDQSPRKVTTVDAKGKPVRVLTTADVVEGVFARARIELAVSDAVRRIHCKVCNKRLLDKRGRFRAKSGLCRPCCARKTGKSVPAEVRRKNGRNTSDTLTFAQRSKIGRAGAAVANAADRRKERSEKMKTIQAGRTREQRSTIARKAVAARKQKP